MSLQRYFWDFLERCLKSLSMHVKSKWQFKNSSLEKSRKSFGISDHMSQEKIAFSLYSHPVKTTMLFLNVMLVLYTEAKLFFASLRAAGSGMSTNFLPFNARSGLSISLKSPYAEGIQNARVSELEKGQEMPFALTWNILGMLGIWIWLNWEKVPLSAVA